MVKSSKAKPAKPEVVETAIEVEAPSKEAFDSAVATVTLAGSVVLPAPMPGYFRIQIPEDSVIDQKRNLGNRSFDNTVLTQYMIEGLWSYGWGQAIRDGGSSPAKKKTAAHSREQLGVMRRGDAILSGTYTWGKGGKTLTPTESELHDRVEAAYTAEFGGKKADIAAAVKKLGDSAAHQLSTESALKRKLGDREVTPEFIAEIVAAEFDKLQADSIAAVAKRKADVTGLESRIEEFLSRSNGGDSNPDRDSDDSDDSNDSDES